MHVLFFLAFFLFLQNVRLISIIPHSCNATYDHTTPLEPTETCSCPPDKTCLRKCCAQNYVQNISMETGKSLCVPMDNGAHLWNLPTKGDLKDLKQLENSTEQIHIIEGKPCRSYTMHEEAFQVSRSGVLSHDYGEEKMYCLEYSLMHEQVLPFVCYDEPHSDEKSMPLEICRLLACIVSIIALFLTFLIYATLPTLQNMHGLSLMCHVFSLMTGYATWSLVALAGSVDVFTLPACFCIISAFTVQFSFLSSFFWLNIMCIDVWWTFSGYRSFSGSPKERDSKKFLVYCLYAWGCPSLIVAITIFVQYSPIIPDWLVRPGFGDGMCWFTSHKAIVIYFYSFISIILFTNLLMFISTTLILKRHKKEAKLFKRSGSRRHTGVENDKQRYEDGGCLEDTTEQYSIGCETNVEFSQTVNSCKKTDFLRLSNFRFNLYLKLFIVMGVNWIMEVLSFFFPDMGPLWIVTDIGNMLQGVFIFLIFVCKRKILLLLNKKLFPARIIFESRRTLDSQSTSGSSVASMKTPKHQLSTRLSNLQNGSLKSPSFAV